ncbi:hypothetical protein C7I85_28090 [Mesorhizobium soli]|uniref:Uncharacterized protein n=1 Tax=Pseudaminobacter soli (ex Li et al. 2025) TaxID=1295366 RepID=A0A2P7RTY8_9HYPH|nr:hypothetical protein C7I85_28090 [Mesorhizobium soli]
MTLAPALRYGSGRSSFEKPNRWLFVRFADHSSPSLILRCSPTGRASKNAPIHRHARFSPSGYCQRTGKTGGRETRSFK